MDSSASTELVEPAVQPTPEGKLQRLLPVARSLTGKVRTLSWVSAASAVVLWWILFEPQSWADGVTGQWAGLAIVVLAALLIPAFAAYVSHRTLQEILNLPDILKDAAADAAIQTKELATVAGASKRNRLTGFFRAIWSLRSLVLESSGAWGKAFAAVRLARLASLPFVLLLLGAFALNFVVIAVAALAVLLVIAI